MAISGGSRTGIKLEAARVSWGRRHCRRVTFVDDVAGSLSGEYFDLNAIDSSGVEVKYYVLLEGSTPPVDPAPAGKTKISVSYTDGDSASVIAGLAETAINAVSNFNVTNGGAYLQIQNKFVGEITEEDQSNAGSLTFALEVEGLGGDLGLTSGGISLNMETTSFEVRADQSAELLRDEIFTGNAATLEMSLIEMTLERWKTLVGSVAGDSYTPSGGTELIGFGESKLYKSALDYSGELVLHPIRLEASDKSEDVVFWLSAPVPASINYSGTEQQSMEVTFKAYLDDSKPKAINLFAIGDHTQTL